MVSKDTIGPLQTDPYKNSTTCIARIRDQKIQKMHYNKT